MNKQTGIGTPEPVELKEKCKMVMSTSDMENLHTERQKQVECADENGAVSVEFEFTVLGTPAFRLGATYLGKGG